MREIQIQQRRKKKERPKGTHKVIIKTNPKLGQFQQSPKVPFSDSPTVKGKKEKQNSEHSRSTSAFLSFLNKKRSVLKRRYRNDEKVVSEATKIWRSMTTAEKEKYHRMAREQDIIKGKSSKEKKRFSVSKTKQHNRYRRMVPISIQRFKK